MQTTRSKVAELQTPSRAVRRARTQQNPRAVDLLCTFGIARARLREGAV
jgi:hypothetical protein